jgi:hypothetical protein
MRHELSLSGTSATAAIGQPEAGQPRVTIGLTEAYAADVV